MGADAPVHAAQWARAAERAGLGSLWVTEDYFHPGAFTLAGAAAAVTERITIGLGVLNPYTRHPALLTMETAALAGAAPGRVVLGLGSGNRHWMAEQMGIVFNTPLADLRECVSIVRRLLSAERLEFQGKRFLLQGVQLEPASKHAVPILLGVKGPRALRLAGEVADGILCSILSSPAHVRRARETASAGRRAFVVAAYVTCLVDDDGSRARRGVKPLLAHYLGVLHGQSILEDVGLGPDRTQAFRDALRRGQEDALLVTDEMAETLSISGTPEQCRQQLRRWAQAGLDAPVAVVPKHADLTEQIALIGRELAPAWKELRCR
jgi:5,10-methylenetetrahydromethanopterin reductase